MAKKEEKEIKMKKEKLARIIESRTLVLSAPVSKDMFAETVQLLTFMESESKTDPVKIIVNSPGGDAYSGFGLYDYLSSSSLPLRVVINGLCASAGILLLLSASKENRYTLPNSRFMIHQPRGGAGGTSSDIQIKAKEIVVLKQRYFEIVAEKCGKTLAEVSADADRDFWLSAKEAKDYGLVGHVIKHQREIS